MNFEESAKSRGLRGNMGHVGAWVRGLRGSNFYAGCVGYAGQKIFYVGHNFCVGCLGQYVFAWVFAWIKIFCVGLFLPCVSFYLIDQIILLY